MRLKDRVAVVTGAGSAIVEAGESRALFDNPQTEYTRALVEAVPHLRIEQVAKAVEGQLT